MKDGTKQVHDAFCGVLITSNVVKDGSAGRQAVPPIRKVDRAAEKREKLFPRDQRNVNLLPKKGIPV
jgi:hypothetical protein